MSAYAFELKLVCGGFAYFSTLTSGSKPGEGGLEFRTPSSVDKEKFTIALGELGLSCFFVHDEQSFYDWTCIQGWAIADMEFARTHMSHWLKKRECLVSPYGSFTDIEIASPSVRKRSFRGKFKRRILARDNNQCLLCPSTERLTLQHVRPYSQGGETSSRNLVTLCEGCNNKMSDDYYRSLYDLAGLRYSYEPSILRGANFSEQAIIRAAQLSRNIMHARCDLY